MKKKEEDKIELISEEFHDVLGSVPPWILRWGITVLAILIIILLIGSSIFKYPDTVSAAVTLTGDAPPAVIVAKTSGKLRELFIEDNQRVNKNQYLAVIDNPANTRDVLFLKDYLNTIDINCDTLNSLPPQKLILGNLQPLFTSLYTSLFEYNTFKRLKYYPMKMNLLKERIKKHDTQYKNLLRQKQIIDEQLIISEGQFRRDSLLNKKGVLSPEDIEEAKNRYLQAFLTYENICTSLDNLQIQISQVKESLFDINFQYIDKQNLLKIEINTVINQLQNEIQAWEMNYVLCSPIDGKITFTSYWVVNQNVVQGGGVFNIIPDNYERMIVKASLPITRSGKVKIGQAVNIHFDNFPVQEYGIVKGRVNNISLVPVKESDLLYYTVEIRMINELFTTYNVKLPYLPEMRGHADIITSDITLLERIMMPIKLIISEYL